MRLGRVLRPCTASGTLFTTSYSGNTTPCRMTGVTLHSVSPELPEVISVSLQGRLSVITLQGYLTHKKNNLHRFLQ